MYARPYAEGEERIRRVVGEVRALPADALHRGRKLERERSRRCGSAEHDLEQCLVRRSEAREECGSSVGDLGDHGGAIEVDVDDRRDPPHELEQPGDVGGGEAETARMEEGLDEVAVAGLVRGLYAHQGDVGVLRGVGNAQRPGQCGAVEPLEVHTGVAAEREHVALVLQQHERARLCPVTALQELRLADDVGGSSSVDVRVVEEAEPELVA